MNFLPKPFPIKLGETEIQLIYREVKNGYTIIGDNASLPTFFYQKIPTDQTTLDLTVNHPDAKQGQLIFFSSLRESKTAVIKLPSHLTCYIRSQPELENIRIESNYHLIQANNNHSLIIIPHTNKRKLEQNEDMKTSNETKASSTSTRKKIRIISSVDLENLPSNNPVTHTETALAQTKRWIADKKSRLQIAHLRLEKYLADNKNNSNNNLLSQGRPLKPHQYEIMTDIYNCFPFTKRREEIELLQLRLEAVKNLSNKLAEKISAEQFELQRVIDEKSDIVANVADTNLMAFYESERKLYQSQLDSLIAKQSLTNTDSWKYVVPLVTGGGKTCIFLRLAKITGLKTLIIVPTVTLVDQTFAACTRDAAGVTVAKLFTKEVSNKDKQCLPDETVNYTNSFTKIIQNNQIIITSYQTLTLHPDEVDFDLLDAVVLDEGHQSKSDRRKFLIDRMLKAGCSVSIYSATPGTILDDNDTCYSLLGYESNGSNNPVRGVPTVIDAIDRKIITPVACGILSIPKKITKENYQTHIEKISTDIILKENGPDGLPLRFKSIVIFGENLAQIAKLETKLNEIAIDEYDSKTILRTRYANNLQAQSTSEAKRASQQFKIAAAIKKEMSRSDKAAIIQKVATGGIGVILTVDALLEGFDASIMEVALFLRNSQSTRINAQAAGRILRLHPGKQVSLFIQVHRNDDDINRKYFISTLNVLNNKYYHGIPETYFSDQAMLSQTSDYFLAWRSSDNIEINIPTQTSKKSKIEIQSKQKPHIKIITSVVENANLQRLKDSLTEVTTLFEKMKSQFNLNKETPEPNIKPPHSDIKNSKDEKQASIAPKQPYILNDNDDDIINTKDISHMLKTINEEITVTSRQKNSYTESTANIASNSTSPSINESERLKRLAMRCKHVYQKINTLLLQQQLPSSVDKLKLLAALQQMHSESEKTLQPVTAINTKNDFEQDKNLVISEQDKKLVINEEFTPVPAESEQHSLYRIKPILHNEDFICDQRSEKVDNITYHVSQLISMHKLNQLTIFPLMYNSIKYNQYGLYYYLEPTKTFPFDISSYFIDYRSLKIYVDLISRTDLFPHKKPITLVIIAIAAIKHSGLITALYNQCGHKILYEFPHTNNTKAFLNKNNLLVGVSQIRLLGGEELSEQVNSHNLLLNALKSESLNSTPIFTSAVNQSIAMPSILDDNQNNHHVSSSNLIANNAMAETKPSFSNNHHTLFDSTNVPKQIIFNLQSQSSSSQKNYSFNQAS